MKKKVLSLIMSLVMILGFVGIMPKIEMKVEAKNITSFQQTDSRWGSHAYGYSDAACTQRATISSGGCGILAYVNAVYYMNGSFIEPVTLADWSVSHGHRVNGSGTAYSLYKSFADSCGSQYNFKFTGTTSSFSTLKTHLQKGGTAVYGAPGHIMCVVDYNASNGTYLLLDSYKSTNRGTYSTGGYRWLTQSEFTGKVAVNVGFHMIENITASTPVNRVPEGVLDNYAGGNGSVYIRGWGFDPDNTSASTRIDVYLYNVNDPNTAIGVGSTTANVSRDDVNNVYGCGSNHGFDATISVNVPTGNYIIKAAVIDTAGGTAKWLEGGTVTITQGVDLGDDFVASITMKSSGKYVTASGSNVVLCGATDKNFAKNHYWHFIKNSNGYYNIYSYSNGQALDLANFQNENGANIGTCKANGASAQDWKIISVNGGYAFTPRCSTDFKVMDVAGASTADNTNIQLYERNDSASQIFCINNVSDTTKPVISKVWFSNISKDMFRVEIDVNDNLGLKEVKVPVWSNENGQDDLIWYNATQYTHNHWYCDVYVKNHNNNYGTYSVDIYAYDFFKQADEWRGSNSKRQTASIGIFELTCDANGGKLGDGTTSYSPKSTDAKFMYNNSNYSGIAWLKPVRSGYTFQGWYTAKTGGTKIYDANGKCVNEGTYFKNNIYQKWSDLTVYAQWKANGYTVTFNANGGSCSTANKSVTYGETYGTLPTSTQSGYTFLGWYTAKTGGTKITADTKVAITSGQTLYAQWKANTYTRTLELDGGTCDKTSITVTYGQKVGTLPTPTKTGYTFAGWYNAKTGGTKVDPNATLGYAGNSTWYARWTVNTYTRTLDAMGGKCDKTSITVTFGQKVGELPIPTKTGYKFVGWHNVNGDIVKSEAVVGGASDGVYYAQWEAKGDFNKDDEINVRDVAKFQRHLASNEALDSDALLEADLNDDGKINVFDIIIMKRMLS